MDIPESDIPIIKESKMNTDIILDTLYNFCKSVTDGIMVV
jgi:hypothetical protein